MALDGITVAALTAELNQTILNGRISKIAQPEGRRAAAYHKRHHPASTGFL